MTAHDPALLQPSDESLYREVLAIARRRFASPSAERTFRATDLANEVFVRAVVPGKLVGLSSNERARYCTAALHNMVTSALRRPVEKLAAWTRIEAALVTEERAPAQGRHDVQDALAALRAVDGRQAEIVELMDLRGVTRDEVARRLGTSERTVSRERTLAKAWLRARLADPPDAHESQPAVR
ncbi:MAG: sigma-70 family RNA polymerase sigma factor [Planctomycetota bacterium]